MFGLCYKRLQLLLSRHCSIAVNSGNQFHCIQKGLLFSSSYSSKSLAQTDNRVHCFTVSYYINSCGLSPELALITSKKTNARFESPERPDSVLKLLKHYGLSDAHISIIVKRLPNLLLIDAQMILLPKLEFFSSIGISGNALSRMLCCLPAVLTSSLERCLKPCYEMSRILHIQKEKVPQFFISCRRLLNAQKLSNVARNVSVLRNHDVPESSFPLWVPRYALALSCDSEKVKEDVKKVISMGFCPWAPTFMNALYVISVTDASKWEQKMKFYKKWGWTEDDVLMAFQKDPLFMAMSEKSFSSKFDFLVREMGFQPAYVAHIPNILHYSLKRRIIPRCSVVEFLKFKGFIMEGKYSLATMLTTSDKLFLVRFVIRYQEQAPELLSIFQGKIALAELGLGFAGRGEVKQM